MKKLNVHFKILFLISLFLVSANISYSQWTIVGELAGLNANRPQLSVVDENTAFVTGGNLENATYKTTNGGINWIRLNTGASRVFWAIHSNDGNTVFAGDDGSEGNSYFYKNFDGESIWTVIDSIPPIVSPSPPGFRSIKFSKSIPSFGIAHAEGDTGDFYIYKTRDGGNNWSKTLVPGYPGYYSATGLIVIDSLFYAFGTTIGPPSIKITTDGGVTWNLRGTNLPQNAYNKGRGLAFKNKLIGIAGTSSSPKIARTTDGGLTWETIDVGNNIIQGIGPAMRWIEGTDICYMTVKGSSTIGGVIKGVLKSTNGGLNWTAMETDGVGIIYIDTKRIGSNIYGYAISYDPNVFGGNLVLKFTDVITGINQISEIVPDGFSLSQNYPNPFNPTTVISYQLSVSSVASLKIYDVLGNEVATLVNEKQNAGSYSVDFDGSNFSSGVYFYKLKVNENIIDTKRMVLLK